MYSREITSPELLQGIGTLLNASIAESSKGTYRRVWRFFNDFSVSVFGQIVHPPLTVSIIALFVAYLHHLNLSYKTINTYLSAMAYVHKMLALPNPTSQFLISRLVRGAQNLAPSYDLRLPITINILDKLVAALEHVAQSIFHRMLFTAMFLFAFNTFARVGEITLSNHKYIKNVVKIEDVQIIYFGNVPCKISATFRHFKHSKGRPHVIEFDKGDTQISVIEAMLAYLSIRGKEPGPLFVLADSRAVPRSLFECQLRKCLSFCGLDSSRYKSHSFRIGRATDCAAKGYSDAYICSLGRWHSAAFRKYIRL